MLCLSKKLFPQGRPTHPRSLFIDFQGITGSQSQINDFSPSLIIIQCLERCHCLAQRVASIPTICLLKAARFNLPREGPWLLLGIPWGLCESCSCLMGCTLPTLNHPSTNFKEKAGSILPSRELGVQQPGRGAASRSCSTPLAVQAGSRAVLIK